MRQVILDIKVLLFENFGKPFEIPLFEIPPNHIFYLESLDIFSTLYFSYFIDEISYRLKDDVSSISDIILKPNMPTVEFKPPLKFFRNVKLVCEPYRVDLMKYEYYAKKYRELKPETGDVFPKYSVKKAFYDFEFYLQVRLVGKLTHLAK